MTNVVVQGVCASYGQTRVLEQVSFDVPSGAMLAVLGSSGSGKTTLLRVLAGFKSPVAGEITFGSTVITNSEIYVPTQARGIGFVPQEGALFPHLSVEKNVAFGLKGWPDSQNRVNEVLELVGMQNFSKKQPHELSGGQSQRVALARALAPKPKVLLMDEPFSALDKGLREDLGQEVKRLLNALNTTSIVVTHDQEEALGLADHVLVIMNGTVAQMGLPQEIYEQPASLEVGQFVGDLIELPVTGWFESAVQCALGRIEVARAPRVGSESHIVCVRPEQISLGAGSILATIQTMRYHGYDTVVALTLATGEQLSARVPGRVNAQIGDRVPVCVNGTGLIFLAQ